MPFTADLNLSKIGVKTDAKGYVITDQQMKTSVEGVYAIGDVRGQPLLAHKASKEGIVAAEVIAGLPSAADWKSIPWAIFTDPEIAGRRVHGEGRRRGGSRRSRGAGSRSPPWGAPSPPERRRASSG